MRSKVKKTYYFHAQANSLGGFLEKPIQKVVPNQAAVSLPAVGGHAAHRTEAFNFEEIVSCRSAYTRVSGKHGEQDGVSSTVVTSVVEKLNILDIVTAERIVAQISVDHPYDGGEPRISFAGSHFDGLKVSGRDASLTMNSILEGSAAPGVSGQPVTWPLFEKTGRQQAVNLTKGLKDGERDVFQWVTDRYSWMASGSEAKAHGCVICSLVDGVNPAVPGRSFGHVVHIPHFGKIFFGEVLASSPTSVHLSMVRAELGCAVTGQLSAGVADSMGHMVPP